MLMGIPPILSPELMKVLMEMGHGDELVLGDANFPSTSMGRRIVRADGHSIVPLLDAIMQFFPLDEFVQKPVLCMAVPAGTKSEPPIWDEYRKVLAAHVGTSAELAFLGRFEFYDRAREAFAVVATGERALYGNLLLKKGVVA